MQRARGERTGSTRRRAHRHGDRCRGLRFGVHRQCADAEADSSTTQDAACDGRPLEVWEREAIAQHGCGTKPAHSACACGDKGSLQIFGDGPPRALVTSCADGPVYDGAACARASTITACDDKGCLHLAFWLGTSYGGHYVDRSGACLPLHDIKVSFASGGGIGEYVRGSFTAVAESCERRLELSGDFRACLVAFDSTSCE